MSKNRTLNEIRQTKDAIYKAPKSHEITKDTTYTFSKKGLIDLLEQYRNADELPEDFVNTIIP
ncbi:MAG: hypothetical protein CMP57_02085 [Flavobacteriales bacterium]|nr:hypothetical protein [Flavobacteriales bacterium]|tara:strand:+ start:313 stop:501 length:189 start_codon:yes stop_codon:yes gene_type:complete